MEDHLPEVDCRTNAEIVPLRLDQVNACVGNVLPLFVPFFTQLYSFHHSCGTMSAMC